MGFWDNFQPENIARPGGPGGPISERVVAPGLQAPAGSLANPGQEDPQAVFQELMAGKPITLETMQAIEAELARRTGARLEYNARRNAADLRLPNGQIVDVVQGFEGPLDQRRLQWNPGGGPGAGGYGMDPGYSLQGANNLASFSAPGLAAPWTQEFNAPGYGDVGTDPAFQFRMKEGAQAIERSAASRGTLLTGGTLKDLTAWAQGLASEEYDKIYGRRIGEYQMNRGTFWGNQENAYNRLYGLSSLGQNAAGMTSSAGTSYGANAGNTLTGIANSRAAGTAASGAAWGGALSNLGNVGANLAMYYGFNRGGPVNQMDPYSQQRTLGG